MIASSSSADPEDADAADFRHFRAFSCPNVGLLSEIDSIQVAGSFAEVMPTLHDCAVSLVDIDVMLINRHLRALPPHQHPSSSDEQQRLTVVDIRSDDVPPGFARLVYRDTGRYLTFGQALYDICTSLRNPCIPETKPAAPAHQIGRFDAVGWTSWLPVQLAFDAPGTEVLLTGIDTVSCIRSPVWPDEAAEWVTRRRRNGWPSQSLIDQGVRTGCAFVTTAHFETKYPLKFIEFRFSFSFAERLLIRNWAMSQKFVFNSLKQTANAAKKRAFTKLGLCSYHLKTLMFWACENKDVSFWAEDRLNQSIQAMLVELIVRMITTTTKRLLWPTG